MKPHQEPLSGGFVDSSPGDGDLLAITPPHVDGAKTPLGPPTGGFVDNEVGGATEAGPSPDTATPQPKVRAGDDEVVEWTG